MDTLFIFVLGLILGAGLTAKPNEQTEFAVLIFALCGVFGVYEIGKWAVKRWLQKR
mgnify:CR=1 FL=1